MVRGINRNIIEITDTGSECFERAILFVKPEGLEEDQHTLQRRARAWLQGLRLRPGILRRLQSGWGVLRLVLAAAAGAGITAILFCL